MSLINSIETVNDNGDTPLYVAAKNGQFETIKLLLDCDAKLKMSDIKIPDKDQRTLLYMAAHRGEIEIIRFFLGLKLISEEVVNGVDTTALHEAVLKNQIETVKLLLERNTNINLRDKDGWTPLQIAAVYGRMEMVKLLLEHGAKLKAIKKSVVAYLLHKAAEDGQTEMMNLLLDYGVEIEAVGRYNRMPLHVAVEHGQIEMAKLLLEHGVNRESVDKDNWTVLHIAAGKGHKETTKLLLDCGAKTETLENNFGATPLHIAVLNGHIETTKLLLEYSANIEALDRNNRTPLQRAVQHDRMELVKVLLENSANIEAEDENGRTPLHMTAQMNYAKIAELLIQHNARLEAKDIDILTPLYIAAKNRYKETVKVLLEYKAFVLPQIEPLLKKINLSSYLQTCFEKAITTIRAHQETKISLFGNWLTAFQMTQLVETLKHNHIIQILEIGQNIEIASLSERIWLEERFHCSFSMQYAIRYAKENKVEALVMLLKQDSWLQSVKYTPLHIAILADAQDLCRDLVLHNHTLKQVDVLGRTPSDVAKERGYTNLKRLAKETAFQKLIVEQANAVAETKAFTTEAQKLNQILDTMVVLDNAPEEPLGFLLHHFWEAANNADAAVKRLCFSLQPHLLYPDKLLKKEGYSAIEKIQAAGGMNTNHPLFANIRAIIKNIRKIAKEISEHYPIEKEPLFLLKSLEQTYQIWVEAYIKKVLSGERVNININALPVWMVGVGRERCLLTSETAEKFRPVAFQQQSEADSGASVVKIWNGVHFKQSPHAPGVEFMVASLSNLVAGRAVTPTELIKIIGADGLHTVYQASKTVRGENLEDIIKERPHLLEKIESRNFSAMIFTSLLTDPQDGKPDNYMVELHVNPDKSIDKLEIISIDNDIAFADPIVQKHVEEKKELQEKLKEETAEKEKQGKYFVNVKNVLYFFPQMDQPVEVSFRDHFLATTPEFIVAQWLSILKEQNQRYQSLLDRGVFSREEFEGGRSQKRGLQLPIKLVEGTVRRVYHKLIMLQDYLQTHPNATHNDLFACIESGIYHHYQTTRANHASIMDCIKTLYEESISSVQDLRYFQQEVAKGNTRYMTQQVLKTADEFGFEDKRHQAICGTGVDAISEYIAAIDYTRFDGQSRVVLYRQLDTLQPQAMQVFQALLKNPKSEGYAEHCLSYVIEHLKLDPHVPQVGGYLLHQVVAHKRTDIVVLLLDRYQVDVHARSQTDRNRTALHMAAAHWDHHTVKALLERGADSRLQDSSTPKGKTPIEVVRPVMRNSGNENSCGRDEEAMTSAESSREETLMLLQVHTKASPLVRHNLFATTHRQHRKVPIQETILKETHREMSTDKKENLVSRTRSSALQTPPMLRVTSCSPVRPVISPINQQESEISQTSTAHTNISDTLAEVGLFNAKHFTVSIPELNAESEETTEPGRSPSGIRDQRKFDKC